ncbi:MAG: SoxR reducing system RseC family protein [Clostridia bacterium]|nr:SoxR reducing system RseC family protein [Clostridia bacterium]
MTETGKVVSTDGKYATVRVDKKDECAKCGMCVFGKNVNYVEFSALNTPKAKEGDTVTFEKREGGRLLASVLVFLVPLLLIALSAVVSILVIKNEIWILFLSLISVIVWYTILAIIDKKLKKSSAFSAEILRIESEDIKEKI